ncbi:MAG TPA: DUF3015 family protein [Nitrospira sp.]|nr:DUF3015 family protein [Nitrospira sp.]
MRKSLLTVAGLTGLLSLSIGGCTIKATTDETLDTTSNITVSTSGRTWWNENGLLKQEHQALAFVSYAEANLEQDVAQGRGEYLASLGSVLGIDPQEAAGFSARAQQEFLVLTNTDQPTRLRALRALGR